MRLWQVLIFLSVIQVILWLGHFLVYKTLVNFWGSLSDGGIVRLKIVFFILSISFLVASLLANRFINPLIDWFYTGAAVWLGTLHFLVLASLAYGLVKIISFWWPVNFNWGITGASFFIVAVILSVYSVYNSQAIKIKQYDIAGINWPAAWQGQKAILLSDSHLGNIYGVGRSAKIVKLVNNLKPAAVFIPGDFYDGPPADYIKLAEPWKNLQTPLGIYFSNGNHEEFGDSSPYTKALAGAGITILNNKSVEVKGLQIAGVTFKDSNSSDGLADLMSNLNLDKAKPTVLLKHVPFVVDTATEAGVDLVLSGHTHVGQMWPFNYLARAVYKGLDYGWHKVGEGQLITTSGVGTWGPPQRLGSSSEIVVINFN
ncbi:metallophosphoesterase [Patescibacteria group bacterium]|nr:metallophosphoesterase [Patescibacteria group bacterium]